MKIEYLRTANHSYMIVREADFLFENYEVQMILHNEISSLLGMQIIIGDGRTEYWYDVTGMQSLEKQFAVASLNEERLRNLFYGICEMKTQMEEYMLDDRNIDFSSAMVFCERGCGRIRFCYIPGYSGEEAPGIRGLLEDVLQHLDHSDSRAVSIGYEMYENCVRSEFLVSDCRKCLSRNREDGYGFGQEAEEEVSALGSEPPAGRGRPRKRPRVGMAYDGLKRIEPEYTGSEYARAEYSGSEGAEAEYLPPEYAEPEHSRSGRMGSDYIGSSYTGSDYIESKYAGAERIRRGRLFGAERAKLSRGGKARLSGGGKFRRMGVKILSGRKRKERRLYGEDFWEETDGGELYEEDEPEQEQHWDQTVCFSGEEMENVWELSYRGDGIEENIRIDRLPFLIGKEAGKVDGVLHAQTVSRIHARISESEDGLLLEDYNSTNGTYLNGRLMPMNTPTAIRRGDQILFATEEYILIDRRIPKCYCEKNQDREEKRYERR